MLRVAFSNPPTPHPLSHVLWQSSAVYYSNLYLPEKREKRWKRGTKNVGMTVWISQTLRGNLLQPVHDFHTFIQMGAAPQERKPITHFYLSHYQWLKENKTDMFSSYSWSTWSSYEKTKKERKNTVLFSFWHVTLLYCERYKKEFLKGWRVSPAHGCCSCFHSTPVKGVSHTFPEFSTLAGTCRWARTTWIKSQSWGQWMDTDTHSLLSFSSLLCF